MLIVGEEERTLRAVLVGMLRGGALGSFLGMHREHLIRSGMIPGRPRLRQPLDSVGTSSI